MLQNILIYILTIFFAIPVLAESCSQVNEGKLLTIDELNCLGFDFIEGNMIEISKGSIQGNPGRRFDVERWAKGRGFPFPSLIGLRSTWKSVSLRDTAIRNVHRENILAPVSSGSPNLNRINDFFNKVTSAEGALNNRIRNTITSGASASLYEQLRVNYNLNGCSYYLGKNENCEYLRYAFFGLYLTLKRGQEIFVSQNSSLESDIQKSILNIISGDDDQARSLIAYIYKYIDSNDPAHLSSAQYIVGVMSGVFKPNGDFVDGDWDQDRPFKYVNSWRANIALLRSFKAQGDFEGEFVTTQTAKRLDQLKQHIDTFFLKADTGAINHFTPQQFYTDLSLLQSYYVSVGEIPAAEAVGVFRANFRASNANLTPSPQDRSVLTKFWGPLTSYGTAIFPLLMAWLALTFLFGVLMYISNMSIGYKTRTINIGGFFVRVFKQPVLTVADPSFDGHFGCLVDSIYGASQLMTLRDYEKIKYKFLKTVLSLVSAVFASFVLSYFVTYVSRAL